MISALKSKLINLTGKGNVRSQKIIKNVLLAFGVKGGFIVVSLIMVPLTISYINPTQYGIWLTISSFILWMSFFDVGMGNGLRNKVTTALANSDYAEARTYVSTTYALLVFISIAIFVVLGLIIPIVNWNKFLNVPSNVSINLIFVVFVVLCSFCVQFVVQIVNTILIASHESAKASLITFLGQLTVLIFIFVLKKTIPGSLNTLILALTTGPILVLIIASIILYRTKLKELRPSFKLINFKYSKNILNSGGVFFIIQVGSLLLFQTDNIIITKVINPAAVTTFNVTYRYFSVITMVFNIFITPYWSAFADAQAKQDFVWMNNAVARLRKILVVAIFVVVPIFLLASDFLLKLWIGNEVTVPFTLRLVMALYVIGFMILALNSFFLNGVGKLRIQFYLYIFSMMVNIPLGIFLAKRFGVVGVTASNVVIFVYMNIILWIQSNKILKQTAGNTLWNR